MQTRAIFRVAFIVVFTTLAIVMNGSDIILPWHPFATKGFTADTNGIVRSVDPIAEQHGLHLGDRIDINRLSPSARFDLYANESTALPVGTIYDLPLVSGRAIALPVHLYPRSLFLNVSDITTVVALWIAIGIAAFLVLLRPMPATWAFYVFSFWVCAGGVAIFAMFPVEAGQVLFSIRIVASIAAAVAFFSFALRFPNAHPKGLPKAIERAAIYGLAPLLAILTVSNILTFLWAGSVPFVWAGVTTSSFILAFYVAAVTTLFARYAKADEESRNRLRWVVATFSVAYIPYLGAVIGEIAFQQFSPIAFNIGSTLMLVAPVALAYTVLRHRLFDIRFVMSRALIYGVMTSLVIGVLALVDWAFSRWLAESRFALVAELGMALLLGVTLTTLHRRLERFLNAVIFRAQALALQTLRRFASETDLISDPQRLLSQTYEAMRTRLESTYAAIYTIDGSLYALASPKLETTPTVLPSDDFAVLRLRRWSESFECDETDHPLRGALFVPMVVRGQLVGFLVCGPKRDGTHYLPEEIDTLATLAHRTGMAYAWLTLRPGAESLAVPAT